MSPNRNPPEYNWTLDTGLLPLGALVIVKISAIQQGTLKHSKQRLSLKSLREETGVPWDPTEKAGPLIEFYAPPPTDSDPLSPAPRKDCPTQALRKWGKWSCCLSWFNDHPHAARGRAGSQTSRRGPSKVPALEKEPSWRLNCYQDSCYLLSLSTQHKAPSSPAWTLPTLVTFVFL